MNFLPYLGRSFQELALPKQTYSIECNDLGLDEGLEPTWTVKSRDGSFELHLYENRIINTIFLKPVEGAFPGFDFTAATRQTEVRESMGKPTRSGEAQEIVGMGNYGAFDRYDTQTIVYHFQYGYGEDRLEMVTLMLPTVIQTIGQ